MIDDGFGHWLAGFIDGEGCFHIRKLAPAGNYGCMLAIELRDDDSEVLMMIREQLGFGALYWNERDTSRLDAKPQCRFVVRAKGDCLALIEILDRYPLRAKKARDYAIWREAVIEWTKARRGGTPGRGLHDWTRMGELKQALQEGRRYGGLLVEIPQQRALDDQLSLTGVS